MARRVGSALRRIFPSSRRDESLAEIARSASEISALGRELLRSSMEGARQSTDQRTRILDVMAMEERVRSFAEKSGVDSRETASRTEILARDTDRSSENIATTALHLQQMVEAITASAALMQQFVLRVSEVDSMVATIGDIARQTNLLALNAAIEAANAGKKGDGFSVIAHEIRLLADRTSKSTVEIGDRIEAMCSTARDTDAAMLKGKLAVEESIQETSSLRRSFEGLRGAMHRLESMTAEAAIASDRQIASTNRITQSVQKIDDLALRCTYEADAAAEMSIRMAACTIGLHEELSRLKVPVKRVDEYEQEATREFLAKTVLQQPQVNRAMELLRARCTEAGKPSLHLDAGAPDTKVPGLWFGDVPAEQASSWLDSITAETRCLATIFVCGGKKQPEEQLLRVATTFKHSDGSRAVEVMLNPKGIAVRKLLAKQSHCGTAYVLGKPFLSIYEPLISASGSLVGAIYVGYPLE